MLTIRPVPTLPGLPALKAAHPAVQLSFDVNIIVSLPFPPLIKFTPKPPLRILSAEFPIIVLLRLLPVPETAKSVNIRFSTLADKV